MNCKYCGAEVQQTSPGQRGHRQREYCNDKHRQAFFRQQHQNDQAAALLAEVQQLRLQVAEIQQLRQRVQELQRENAEFEQENIKVKHLLQVDQWFHSDRSARNFPAFLRKQGSTPFIKRFLQENLLAPLGTRARYEDYLRKGRYSEEEKAEFEHLWKLMLQQS
jgi:regulator of replication initiation timing